MIAISQIDLRKAIDEEIDSIFSGSAIAEYVDEHWIHSLHSFAKSGKKVRPLSLLLTVGCHNPRQARNRQAIHLAACVELAHRSTLISDDVVDGHIVRNNRPTLVTTEGPKIAVFCAQLLQAIAIDACAAGYRQQLNEAIYNTLLGQAKQERFRFTTIEQAFNLNLEVVKLKSSSLGGVALELGASLSGVPNSFRMRTIGMELGKAYQACNDLRDIANWAQGIVHDLPSDLANRTFSYPILLAVQMADLAGATGLRDYMTSRRSDLDPSSFKSWFAEDASCAVAMRYINDNLSVALDCIDHMGGRNEYSELFHRLISENWKHLYLKGEASDD